MYSWELLALFGISNQSPDGGGIVPPVERYAWLELEKLEWRERRWEDESNVPKMQQEDLAKSLMKVTSGERRWRWPRSTFGSSGRGAFPAKRASFAG
jgi:hypothetical protein